jgi:hypothetical protein
MVWDLGRDPEKTYSVSRGQKGTGSRIPIRNTAAEEAKKQECILENIFPQ